MTTQTLFCAFPGKVGVLVFLEKRRRKTKRMRFENAQAALSWCETHQACFVYLPAEPTSQN